jgi:hypothetical protein
MNKLSDKIEETIKDSKFQEVMVDLSEASIDAFLEEGVIKDLPVLGSIYGLAKTAISVQDKLFTKKLLNFLIQLKDTSKESRVKQIEKLESDPKYNMKVGEKLLFIIDKCEDSEKAQIIGRLFQKYLEEKLSYEDFLRASKCIDLTFIFDLRNFVNEKWDKMDIEEVGDLVGSGLLTTVYQPGLVTYDGSSKGLIKTKVSPIGKLIQELLIKL